MKNTELNYNEVRANFSKTIELCFRLSQSFAGEIGDYKKMNCSVIFMKLVMSGETILQILPKLNTKKKTLFDLSSIAGLARNLIENSNILYYYCFDRIDIEEFNFRNLLSECHKNIEFKKMLNSLGKEDGDLGDLLNTIQNSKDELSRNSFFLSLGEAQKRELLRGRKGIFLSHKDITVRRSIDLDMYNAIYKFLSSHLHSTPYSIQLIGNNVMTGLGNKQELNFIKLIVNKTEYYMAKSFIEVIDFQKQKKQLFDIKEFEYLKNKI